MAETQNPKRFEECVLYLDYGVDDRVSEEEACQKSPLTRSERLLSVVSAHYRIAGPVEFVDIELTRDNPVFVDPSSIRNLAATDALAFDAQQRLVSFFTTVLDCIYSTKLSDRNRGEALLQSLHEIKEIRMGWSKASFDGRGAAAELGTQLWNALDAHPVVQIKALTRLEHVPLFVANVGIDLISDFSSRIAFEQLALFTKRQMDLHPALKVGAIVVPHLIWDRSLESWIDVDVELPAPGSKPLVLVPKTWVRRSLLMKADSYYNVTVLGAVRNERGYRKPNGKVGFPYKKDLKTEPGLGSARGTNTSETVQRWESGIDLIEQYRARVDGAFAPLTDDEIRKAVAG